MKSKFLTAVLLLLMGAAQAQINFIHQPEWKDVLAKAKAEKKMIFVDAYTDWCIWCKVMDKNTFPDASVTEYMNKNFINVKMEMETGFGCTLAMKYRVSSFPTFLVLNSEGKFIDRILGYNKPAEFLKTLEKIRTAPVSAYPTGISASIELPFPDFYSNAFIKNKDGKKVSADSTTVINYLDKQTDLTTEVNWSVLYRYKHLTARYDTRILEMAPRIKQLYGKSEADEAVNSVIAHKFKDVMKRKDEAALQGEIFAMIDKHFPENAKEMRANYKLNFYQGSGNYAKALDALDDMLSIPGNDYGGTINAVCWDIYERCEDDNVIRRSVGYMQKLIATDPQYAYLDTYAAILYRAKDYARAEEYALKAIEAGKKENQKVDETEDLLKKIKADAPQY